MDKKYKVIKISPYSMILYAEFDKQYICPCHCLGKIGTFKGFIKNENYLKIEFNNSPNNFSIFYYKDLQEEKN